MRYQTFNELTSTQDGAATLFVGGTYLPDESEAVFGPKGGMGFYILDKGKQAASLYPTLL